MMARTGAWRRREGIVVKAPPSTLAAFSDKTTDMAAT
jgi:hypothetical protein